MTRLRTALVLVIAGFALEQVACGLGVLAIIAVSECAVGITLTVATALCASVGLALVSVGAVAHHRAKITK